jgi:DMSO/TMAO reductase YedYZ molybdopterin-dependent catalytic subunit
MLQVSGEVERPASFSAEELAALPAQWQVPDVAALGSARRGRAVWLAGLLEAVGARPVAQYLTLHAARDDFHASIPLAAVRERAVVIFELDGHRLPVAQGGPFRFLVLDSASCQSAEVDECANVKFVDRLELSAEPGHDNRPRDETAHAALHAQQSQQQQQQQH